MKRNSLSNRFLLVLFTGFTICTSFAQEQVKVDDGVLEGVYDAGADVRSFKGVPFAAPPVGDLRWQPPQPVKPWEGVRRADRFGPRAMQRFMASDMIFRSDGVSEDCLYLNVWTPKKTNGGGLPVLVYFYGGGYQAGDGSEGRYDGESMAGKGIVAVTVNYRLNVFGFFAHQALTAESPHHASGNYGLLDQHAALEWVKRNIAAFGGDPQRVTIAGESAGSFSVSAQLASPLSKGLMAQAIGESGSLVGAPHGPGPREEAEKRGAEFAAGLGIGNEPGLEALRALPAERLLAATAKPGGGRFGPTVDGYLLPKSPAEVYQAGEEARVPLLAGVNSQEGSFGGILSKAEPTVENYRAALQRLYPGHADEVLRRYPATNETEVMDAAQALASDRFISYSTWHWIDLAAKTGGQPTYYYVFTHSRPATRPEAQDRQPVQRGAVHASEIEYALGNLDHNPTYAWTPEDREISRTMQQYFVNFIQTGKPDGGGLPEWPEFASGQHLMIDLHPQAEKNDLLRTRYEFFDQVAGEKPTR